MHDVISRDKCVENNIEFWTTNNDNAIRDLLLDMLVVGVLCDWR